MNFTYENQGTNTYLVYKMGMNEVIDTMSLGMITNNKIPGIAETFFMQLDANKYIKYNVSSKIPISQFFGGAVNRARLFGVFNGIIDAMLSAEEYMIDTHTILLDKNYIFADVSSCDTVLVCVPIIGIHLDNQEMGTFFKKIMFSTQFDQTENCDYVGKIINYLNSAPIFSLSDFKKILEEIKTTVQEKTTVQQLFQPTVSTMQQAPASLVQQPQISKQLQTAAAQSTVLPKTQPAVSARMDIPSRQPEVQQEAKKAEENEKKISMFYLLQHYNKKNAETYKAQKAAKKVKAKEGKINYEKKNKVKKGAANPSAGFAIPGAPVTQTVSETDISSVFKPQESIPQAMTSQKTMPQPEIPEGTSTYVHVVPAAAQSQTVNFGETTVLSTAKIGETTVLSSSSVQTSVYPHLIRMKNNERIEINKPVFRIGKEKSYVDYFISDNSAISRSHANIIIREGEYFIVDTNSTNHTYINDAPIQSNIEVKLMSGTKIRLANEEFEFRL